MKNQNCWRGSLRASVLFAIAIFAFAAPLRAEGPPSISATKSPKQALWVADTFGFSELTGKDIRLSFGIKNFGPGGLTFDSNGNFWGTFCTGQNFDPFDGVIFELTQAQLLKIKSGGKVNPKVFFRNPAPNTTTFYCPSALEFDKAGNLWVANAGGSGFNPSIMKYTPDQLTTGGNVFPAVIFTSPDFGESIFDVKFDGSGNLWLATPGDIDGVVGNRSVEELTSEQLSATGSPSVVLTPNLALPLANGATPYTIAFDQSGNLWVGGFAPSLLLFAASDLGGSGTISPVPLLSIEPVYLRRGHSSFDGPDSLAIDGRGNLWVATSFGDGAKQTFGNVSEYKADQITTSGSPRPSLYIQAGPRDKSPHAITFGPLM